jgi:hypothetical protein
MLATYPPLGCPVCEVLARVVGLPLPAATRLLKRVLERECGYCGFWVRVHDMLHPHPSLPHCAGVVREEPQE